MEKLYSELLNLFFSFFFSLVSQRADQKTQHLATLFSCRALQNLSDQGTYVLGSELILLLNPYQLFFKLWTNFTLLRYHVFSNYYDTETSVTILLCKK